MVSRHSLHFYTQFGKTPIRPNRPPPAKDKQMTAEGVRAQRELHLSRQPAHIRHAGNQPAGKLIMPHHP